MLRACVLVEPRDPREQSHKASAADDEDTDDEDYDEAEPSEPGKSNEWFRMGFLLTVLDSLYHVRVRKSWLFRP